MLGGDLGRRMRLLMRERPPLTPPLLPAWPAGKSFEELDASQKQSVGGEYRKQQMAEGAGGGEWLRCVAARVCGADARAHTAARSYGVLPAPRPPQQRPPEGDVCTFNLDCTHLSPCRRQQGLRRDGKQGRPGHRRRC